MHRAWDNVKNAWRLLTYIELRIRFDRIITIAMHEVVKICTSSVKFVSHKCTIFSKTIPRSLTRGVSLFTFYALIYCLQRVAANSLILSFSSDFINYSALSLHLLWLLYKAHGTTRRHVFKSSFSLDHLFWMIFIQYLGSKRPVRKNRIQTQL